MIERRYIEADLSEPLELEERSGHAPKIRGRAIVYNSRSKDLGGFTEIIQPGAFDHILARQRPKLDVVALWNHDNNQLLGRTTSGTLRLIPDDRGVAFELDPPDTTLGRDLMTLCRRGDIAGCSFAFTVDNDGERVDTAEDGSMTRYIERATGLFDVSLVTNPAYAATAVTVRSVEEARARQRELPPVVDKVEAEPKPLTPRDKLNIAKAKAKAVAVRAVVFALVAFFLASDAYAWPRSRRSSTSSSYSAPVGGDNSTAQGVAEACARTGRLAHMGGNSGHEGLGMASTREGAYRNCCFANSGMADADVGYAQGSNGMWYCCRRYR